VFDSTRLEPIATPATRGVVSSLPTSPRRRERTCVRDVLCIRNCEGLQCLFFLCSGAFPPHTTIPPEPPSHLIFPKSGYPYFDAICHHGRVNAPPPGLPVGCIGDGGRGTGPSWKPSRLPPSSRFQDSLSRRTPSRPPPSAASAPHTSCCRCTLQMELPWEAAPWRDEAHGTIAKPAEHGASCTEGPEPSLRPVAQSRPISASLSPPSLHLALSVQDQGLTHNVGRVSKVCSQAACSRQPGGPVSTNRRDEPS